MKVRLFWLQFVKGRSLANKSILENLSGPKRKGGNSHLVLSIGYKYQREITTELLNVPRNNL
jgi:hypothetical protein